MLDANGQPQQQLATQMTDPSIFADIKNQVIVEAGEKRETSGSPPVKAKKERHKRKDRQATHPPRPNKLDRNTIAKGIKVPLTMNSVSFGGGSADMKLSESLGIDRTMKFDGASTESIRK